MTKTRFPRWKKTFDLTVPNNLSDPLKIIVYDKDKFLQDKFMGQVR
jgi:Ca2+-dependent lipid-binding protein